MALPDTLPRPSLRDYRALLAQLDVEEVTTFADVSGADPLIGVAAHQRFDCDIVLIALDDKGEFGGRGGDWTGAARAALVGNGVPEERIRTVRSRGETGQYDVISGLGRFGVTLRPNNLGWLLRRALHGGSRLLMDIRKGSGGFPFLRRFGNSTPVASWEHEGRPVSRVVMTVEPVKAKTPEMQWGRIAEKLVGPDGFYRQNDRHSLTYIPRGGTLCVTFDNLDIAMNNREDRRPWGYKFIEDQGWSMLGVMANGWTWFRDPWVDGQFDALRDEGFFARFDRVIFYGASMGGYGALVFSAAAPGSDVVVFSPQTVLDKAIVPWETRYRVAWDYDFSGPYGDAAGTVAAARKVYLFYDPYSKLDAAHVARLSGENLVHLRCPFFGHRLGSMLQQMGVLQPLVLAAMEGRLDRQEFFRALRRRRGFRRYRKETVDRLLDRGREAWAAALCRKVLAEGDDRFFRTTLARLEGGGDGE